MRIQESEDMLGLPCLGGEDVDRYPDWLWVTSATDTDCFCSECAATRTERKTDAYDGLSDRFTGEPCPVCGCDEFTAVEHMGRVLFGCAGDGCVIDVLTNVAVTEVRK